jgi:hypothetical protein
MADEGYFVFGKSGVRRRIDVRKREVAEERVRILFQWFGESAGRVLETPPQRVSIMSLGGLVVFDGSFDLYQENLKRGIFEEDA